MSVIDLFEKDLLNKLSFKASHKVSNDTLLLKTFKFFDLNNVGWVPRSEFFRAIAKAGVVISSPEVHHEAMQDMNTIFDYYDRSKEGRIHYQDFVAQVLFKPDQQEEPMRKSTKELIEEKLSESKLYRPAELPLSQSHVIQHKQPTNKVLTSPEEITEYLRERLREEGIDGLLDKAVKLKLLDASRTHKLPLAKVCQALPHITRDQMAKVLRKLNVPEGGEVNYAQLVYFLRGKVSPERNDFIMSTFDRLDLKKQGEIALEEILARNEDRERARSFQKAVEDYCRFQGIDDGVFTDEDFTDFMGFVGFVFSDQDFNLYLNCAYPDQQRRSVRSNRSRREFEDNRSNYQPVHDTYPTGDFAKKPVGGDSGKKSVGSQKAESIMSHGEAQRQEVQSRSSRVSKTTTLTKSIENIIGRITKRLASKGPKGYLSFEKALRSADLDQDNMVSIQEFKKVVRDQRIDISETEAHMVFEVFDPQSTGLMNYQEFLSATKGVVEEGRRRLIARVWDKVKESENLTSFNKLRSVFQVRAHPDIRNGKRYQQEILKELNETLLLVQDLNGVRSEQITRDDFEEYLQNVSYSVEDDRLFQTILIAVWRLTSQNRIEDHYAGTPLVDTGSRKHFDNNKNSYLQDHHRYLVNGGSVSQNAPFGTYNEPTNYATQSRRFDS